MAENTFTYNFNELILAKQQLKSIIQDGGLEPGEVFAQYPGYIASIIEGGGTSSYLLVTKEELYACGYITAYDVSNMSYATQSYVADYVSTHSGGGSGDLSDYVTYTYLYAYVGDALSDIDVDVDLDDYPTFDDISDMGYITMGDVSACGYITAADVPSVDLSSYVSYSYLESKQYLTEVPNDYPTYTAISEMGYITMGDVSACGYITAADVPEVDLDDYVTYGYATANYVSYSYAYNTFVSYSYLGDLEEITEYILGPSSGTSPQNVYATKVELASYATKTELGAYVSKISLESMSYITMDDVSACGYITANDISIPVINENLIPKASDTYTLGDADHLYDTTYTSKIQSQASGLGIRIGNANRYQFYNGAFRAADNNRNLGTSDYKWAATYTSTLYADTAYLQDTSYTKTVVPDGSDTYTLGDTSNYYHTLYTNRVRGSSSVNFVAGGNNRVTVTDTAMRPMQQNYNLGSSDYPFATAYISNIYNFIWTGTSAQYAALDNYTTYQIYMIKES